MSGGRVTIDADSLRSEVRDSSIRVVDVRREDEYRRGHVPGAVSLPLGGLLSDDSPEGTGRLFGSVGIDERVPVAVYDDTFGALASRAAWALEHMGHRQVSLLDVTYSGWASMGMDSEEGGPPDVAARRPGVEPRPDMAASAERVESAAGGGGAVLVDNRERLNYLDQHIPGAVSIPYRMLASPDRILLPPGRMRRLLENRGVWGRDAITYCGSVGTLSGLAYYAFRSAGMEGVRLYARSFKEWKSLQKPVERQEHANYWDLSAE